MCAAKLRAAEAAAFLKVVQSRDKKSGQHALSVLSFGDAKARRLRAEAERAEEIVRRMAKLVDDGLRRQCRQTPAWLELESQLRACGEAPGKLSL